MGVLHMASKDEVLHGVHQVMLLQVDVTRSLCTLKQVDTDCWEKEVVHSAAQQDADEQSPGTVASAQMLWPRF